MAPTRIDLPLEAGIYRGDPWSARFNLSRPFDPGELDLVMQFKADRHGPVVCEAIFDYTHAGDAEDPYVLALIDAADTATIGENVLRYDVQDLVTGRTWQKGTIPVDGEISTQEEGS